MHFLQTLILFLLTSIASVAAVPSAHLPPIEPDTVDVDSPAYWKEQGAIPVIGFRDGRIQFGPDFKSQERVVKGIIRLAIVVTAPVLVFWWLKVVYTQTWTWLDEIAEWIRGEEGDYDSHGNGHGGVKQRASH